MPEKDLPAISFCTTCMGRRHHIEQTLLHNLALCQQHLPVFELVLVNYNSQDGLNEWVQAHLSEAIAQGQVRYHHTTKPTHFHVSHAKNMAHQLAQYPVVVNLDADNTLSIFYLFALSQLKPGEILHVQPDRHFIPGSFGRIALYKKEFMALGGYDEHLNQGWGAEDHDLINRGCASGLKKRLISSPLVGKVIRHSDTERVENRLDQSMNAFKTAREKSQQNIAAGRLVANLHTPWGMIDHNQGDPEPVEPKPSTALSIDFPTRLPLHREQIEYELDLNGYVVIPNMLSPETVQALNHAIDVHQGDALPFKFPLLGTSPMLMDLMEHPLLMPLLKHWLGDWFRLDHAYGLQVPKATQKPTGAAAKLHAGPYQNQGAFQYHWFQGKSQCGLLGLGYNLQDVHPNDGGFVVVPGSHKQHMGVAPNKVAAMQSAARPSRALWTQPVMQAGDLLIFAEALVHGNIEWRNRDRGRRILYYKYAPGYLCWRQYDQVKPYAARAKTPTQQDLLRPPYVAGYDEDDRILVNENHWRTPTRIPPLDSQS
jgi:ectoine hydroxylase-related dioxygenase (phytanoyl-CoA dioxygenase family)